MSNEQQVTYTPDTNVVIHSRDLSVERIPVIRHCEDWSLTADRERVYFEALMHAFCARLGSTLERPYRINLAPPPFEAAACLRVLNTLTGDDYRFYMKADDSRLLAFDNGEVMAALRQLGRYKFIHVAVSTDVHDCSHDALKGSEVYAEIVKQAKEQDNAAYSDTDLRCIRLEHLQIDLLSNAPEDTLKQVFPLPTTEQTNLSASI